MVLLRCHRRWGDSVLAFGPKHQHERYEHRDRERVEPPPEAQQRYDEAHHSHETELRPSAAREHEEPNAHLDRDVPRRAVYAQAWAEVMA